jgi:uncharacterized protein (DUF1800 family)
MIATPMRFDSGSNLTATNEGLRAHLMSIDDLLNDPSQAWAAYEPTDSEPWDRARVAHLHRRAGFAAPWWVLERDVKAGPGPSIDRLLNGEPQCPDGTSASEFDALLDEMATNASASANLTRLQAVWLYRMIHTPHPLRERMTLFWHNHFATSNAKVNNLRLMQQQNDLLRRLALGDFKALLMEMDNDPAMLIWLDAAVNRKSKPNENYAREVMELFTLGRGRYTEKDVQEAARAYTGGFIQNDRFTVVPAQHDDGEKSVLGQTGKFGPDEIGRVLLDQPACAEFLARKLFRHFISEIDTPSKESIAPLAETFRNSSYDSRAALNLILRSRLFHNPSTRRRRVKSPVELTVGTIRSLEVLKPTVSGDALADACTRMGQSLYAPPSVAGWDAGPAWINTTTTLARSNFALGLLSDSDDAFGKRLDPKALVEKNRGQDGVSFFVDLLVQDAFDESVKKKVKGTPKEVATLVLTAPEFQLA